MPKPFSKTVTRFLGALILSIAAQAQTYTIATVAGGASTGLTIGTGDGGPALAAGLGHVTDAASDGFGNLYVASGSLIRKVTPTGAISTIAGGGTSVQDYVPAVQAALSPTAIASTPTGILYVADIAFGVSRIRRIDSSGLITTVAGGSCCTLGDGGPAINAYLGITYGLAMDSVGSLFIAQTSLGDDRIRKVTLDGNINTVAGGGPCCAPNEGGPATSVSLSTPTGVAVDSNGDFYLAEYSGNRVRKVSSGTIQTVAGTGVAQDSGDGGLATQAGLAHPWHVGIDAGVANGAILISQMGSAKVKLLGSDGKITTAAGNGSHGYSGDGSGAITAALDAPTGIGSAGNGVFYLADTSNGVGRVRSLTPPLIRPIIKPGGVVPVFSTTSVIQSGSWVSLYGSNLAPTTALWGGDFPTVLGNTTVTVNGKPAYLWFVSPGQINFQAPDDSTLGNVKVSVITPAGSFAAPVMLNSFGPSFSLLDSKYPAAIVLTPGSIGNTGAGYDIIGPTGAYSFATRPVRKGETLVLFGVGFGPTTPGVAPGSVYSGAAPSVVVPQVTIGGVNATVTFAGIVQAGLFQLNVQVPNVPSGDQPLLAKVGSSTTPSYVTLSVQ